MPSRMQGNPSSGHDTHYVAFEQPQELEHSGACASTQSHSDVVAHAQSQALELAANRAELARQQRSQEELQRAVRLRDGWLQELRTEVKSLQEERRSLGAELVAARNRLHTIEARVVQQEEHIKQLESDSGERLGRTIFSDGASPVAPPPAEALNLENPSKLYPLNEDGAPIILDRKVMSVGRTSDNPIFVPSQLVSRDHARVLVSETNVVLFDVGSANGSFVNDQQIRRRVLRDGDIVRFGDRKFRFSG